MLNPVLKRKLVLAFIADCAAAIPLGRNLRQSTSPARCYYAGQSEFVNNVEK